MGWVSIKLGYVLKGKILSLGELNEGKQLAVVLLTIHNTQAVQEQGKYGSNRPERKPWE